MKVCTDACILGAWAAIKDATKILDIGTGTGLLALMAAQRSNASIHAVELDPEAYQQAKTNVKNSAFARQIEVFYASIQDFTVQNDTNQYSHILCNPPFFENYLPSKNPKRNTALHTQTLPFVELALAINQLLASNGQCFLLLPPFQSAQFLVIANAMGLYAHKQLFISHQPNKNPFRIVSVLSRTNEPIVTESLIIRDLSQDYSPEFRALLQDFYLIF